MTDLPLVSVIVPTFNRPAELSEALGSIAAQRHLERDQVEAIVVNDGGCSTGAAVAAGRERGLPVISVDHSRRAGLATARNTGLELARGRFVAFLDDDDVFLPDHLASTLTQLETTRAHGVVTSAWVSDHRVDPERSVEGAQLWDIGFDPELLEVCNLLPVHAALLRRPTAARFDPTLPAIEDWDFWLNLTRHEGYRFDRARHLVTVVYHRNPATPSLIGAVAAAPASAAQFGVLVRRLWMRWPTTNARSARFRLLSATMYWQVLSTLAQGRAPNPHYYLHSLAALEQAWRDPAAETDLVERLERIVTGAPDDQHSA